MCSGASKRWCRPSLSSSNRKRIYANYEKLFTPFSTSLVGEFHRSAEAIGDLLDDAELEQWAEAGIGERPLAQVLQVDPVVQRLGSAFSDQRRRP